MPDNPVYTPAQANELLPWLRERLAALAAAGAALRASQNTVRSLTSRSRTNGHRDLGPRMAEAEKSVAGRMQQVRAILDEVGARGIQVRDVESGLVDFPGERDGVPVWLCWRLGEESVAFWHERDTGFSGRKPL